MVRTSELKGRRLVLRERAETNDRSQERNGSEDNNKIWEDPCNRDMAAAGGLKQDNATNRAE